MTPPHIVDDLGPFDLDPCGYPDWPTASTLICEPEDGLSQPWAGRVWLNPPYGAAAWVWLDRLADYGCGTALVFARTETAGFVRTVWNRASALRFLHGRLTFVRPGLGPAASNSGGPSVLVAYGEADADRLRYSSLAGSFVELR